MVEVEGTGGLSVSLVEQWPLPHYLQCTINVSTALRPKRHASAQRL